MRSLLRALRPVVTIVVGLGLAGAIVLAPPARADTSKVLIYGPSVTGGSSSLEAIKAVALGFGVDVVDAPTWSSMTAAQFANYRALILGDPTCDPSYPLRNSWFSVENANKGVWAPVVDGNILVNGTDPVFHQTQGGDAMVERGIAFAADVPGKTGLYVSLTCAFHDSAPTDVDVLSPFGTFTVEGVGCYNDAHIVATHPALLGMTDASISNWSCSVHEAFSAWPADFAVLAIARNIGSSYTAADGSVGTPYILARGEGLSASDISLTPAGQTHDVSEVATVTALVTSGGSPQSGQAVTFSVLTGPNAGTGGSGTTAADGTATFSYSGTTTGTDTLQASFVRAGVTQSSNTATVDWTVADTPPAVTIDTAAPSGVEGAPIAIDATATDDHGPLTYSWSSGSLAGLDVGAACSFSPQNTEDTTMTCTDDTNGGTVEAVLTVSDGVNPPVSEGVDVTVANAKPVVTSLTVSGGSATACLEGNAVTASFTAVDAGTNDTHTGHIDWGDGASSNGFSATHTYAAGTYTIAVSATDDDGGTSDTVAGTSTTPVSLQYATNGIEQPINADGSSNFKLGRTVPVKIRVTDCHGNPVATLTPQVALAKVGPGDGTVNELVSSSAADTGTTMRYAGDSQYIFNLSTKLSQFNAGQDLTAGRYRLTITAPSLAPVVVYFDLRP